MSSPQAKARARATAEAAAADLGAEREAHATAPKELADAKDELEALRGAAAASAPPHAAGEAPAESNGNGVDADLESRSEEGRPSAEVEAVGSRGGGAGSFHATDGDLVDSGEALRPEEAACRCKLLAEEQERRARAEGLLEVATEERKELARVSS